SSADRTRRGLAVPRNAESPARQSPVVLRSSLQPLNLPLRMSPHGYRFHYHRPTVVAVPHVAGHLYDNRGPPHSQRFGCRSPSPVSPPSDDRQKRLITAPAESYSIAHPPGQ